VAVLLTHSAGELQRGCGGDWRAAHGVMFACEAPAGETVHIHSLSVGAGFVLGGAATDDLPHGVPPRGGAPAVFRLFACDGPAYARTLQRAARAAGGGTTGGADGRKKGGKSAADRSGGFERAWSLVAETAVDLAAAAATAAKTTGAGKARRPTAAARAASLGGGRAAVRFVFDPPLQLSGDASGGGGGGGGRRHGFFVHCAESALAVCLAPPGVLRGDSAPAAGEVVSSGGGAVATADAAAAAAAAAAADATTTATATDGVLTLHAGPTAMGSAAPFDRLLDAGAGGASSRRCFCFCGEVSYACPTVARAAARGLVSVARRTIEGAAAAAARAGDAAAAERAAGEAVQAREGLRAALRLAAGAWYCRRSVAPVQLLLDSRLVDANGTAAAGAAAGNRGAPLDGGDAGAQLCAPSPLECAIAAGNVEVVKLLLARGASVSADDGSANSALASLVRAPRSSAAADDPAEEASSAVSILSALLAAGVSVDADAGSGRTALWHLIAAAAGDSEELLLEGEGGRPLSSASFQHDGRRAALCRALVEGGADTGSAPGWHGTSGGGGGDFGASPLAQSLSAHAELKQDVLRRAERAWESRADAERLDGPRQSRAPLFEFGRGLAMPPPLVPSAREASTWKAKEREVVSAMLDPPRAVADAAPTDCWPQLFICRQHCVVETSAGCCEVCAVPLQRWAYCEKCDEMHHEDLLLRDVAAGEASSGSDEGRCLGTLQVLRPLARHCAFAQLDPAVRPDFEAAFADKLSLPDMA